MSQGKYCIVDVISTAKLCAPVQNPVIQKTKY